MKTIRLQHASNTLHQEIAQMEQIDKMYGQYQKAKSLYVPCIDSGNVYQWQDVELNFNRISFLELLERLDSLDLIILGKYGKKGLFNVDEFRLERNEAKKESKESTTQEGFKPFESMVNKPSFILKGRLLSLCP